MVENVEHIPDTGSESKSTGLSANDVERADMENFGNIRQNMNTESGQALTAFDQDNNGLEIVGNSDNNLSLVNNKDTTVESGSNPLDTQAVETEATDLAGIFNNNFGLLGVIPFEQREAKTSVNQDGLVSGLDINGSHSRTSIEFTESDGATRTRTFNNSREVTQYNQYGEASSKRVYAAGDTEGKEVPVSEKDYFSVETENGNTILSFHDGQGEQEVHIGPKGNVTSTKEWGKTQKESFYNEDGSIKSDATTTFRDNGFKESRTIQNEKGITNESYDEHGNWQKSVTNGTDYVQTATREADGSTVTITDKADGTKLINKHQPDGTQYYGEMTEDTKSLTTVSPDGSQTRRIETEDSSTYIITGQDGYWMMYNRDKVHGITKMNHGDREGKFRNNTKQLDV